MAEKTMSREYLQMYVLIVVTFLHSIGVLGLLSAEVEDIQLATIIH